eukprot:9195441-Ditylum_brightwellii.AAC.1
MEHQEVHLIHYALTQYSVNKGLRKFGHKAEEAVMDKFKQWHDMQSFEPLQANDLIKEQKQRALHAIMFLKGKCCSRIKGQTCTDGRKQKMQPHQLLHQNENRDVAITDILGAYLNGEMDDYVIMVLEGSLAKLLVKMAPSIRRKYLGIGKDN